MEARRLLFFFGLAAALAAGLALRLTTREQLIAGGRTRALGSDDDYHLRRARFAVAHFPRTILFDPLMNFPEGGVPIWPPLFDLSLALPARLLHGPAAPAPAIEREAAWVPLFFAAGSILLAGLLGRRLYGVPGGIAAALFLAFCPGHILWTQFGHTDQHVAESATGLLVLLAFLASRDRPPAGNARRELAAGLALALAVLTWQGAIYWGAVIALALFLEALLLARSVARQAALLLAAPAILVGIATAAWLGPIRPPVTYVSFGFFQPLFLAALAAGVVLLETVVLSLRRELPRRGLAARLAFLAAAAAVLLPFAGEMAHGLANGVGYVLGRTSEAAGRGGYVSYPRGWLKGIFEARPLLADGPGLAAKELSWAFFLSPLVLLLWVWRARRRERPATHLALTIWGAVTLFLALSQRLNVYYAAPLAALCLIEAARFCRARLASIRRLASGAPPVAGAALAGAILLLPIVPGLRQELRAVRVPGSDLFDTLDWMRRELPRAVDPYDPRLLDTPPDPPGLARASSVLAPWSLGHLVLYNAEQPVVANNFGYGFLDSIRFFLAESEDEALAAAGRRRARWVLVTDLVPRINDYASYLGRPAYLRTTAAGLSPTPAYFRTLQSRLYDFDAQGASLPGLTVPPLSRFRLIYRSKSAIRRGGRWLARWKVFEIEPTQSR